MNGMGIVFAVAVWAVMLFVFPAVAAICYRAACYLYNAIVRAPQAPPDGMFAAMPAGGPVPGFADPYSQPPNAAEFAPPNPSAPMPSSNPYASPTYVGAAQAGGPGQWPPEIYPGDGVVLPSFPWAFGVMFAAIAAFWILSTAGILLVMVPSMQQGPPNMVLMMVAMYGPSTIGAATVTFLFSWLGLPAPWTRAAVITIITGVIGFVAFAVISMAIGFAMMAVRI